MSPLAIEWHRTAACRRWEFNGSQQAGGRAGVCPPLATSSAGTPVVLQRLRAADDRFFGPCTYAEGAASLGYLATEQYLGTSTLFRSYATGVPAP